MKTTREQDTRIRMILHTVQCPQDRPCYETDYASAGMVQPVGDTGIIECLEARGRWCECGLPFGDAIFCRCPLRKYLFEQGIR